MWSFTDAQLAADDDLERVDAEQGVPHLKGTPCAVAQLTAEVRELEAEYGPTNKLGGSDLCQPGGFAGRVGDMHRRLSGKRQRGIKVSVADRVAEKVKDAGLKNVEVVRPDALDTAGRAERQNVAIQQTPPKCDTVATPCFLVDGWSYAEGKFVPIGEVASGIEGLGRIQ